jgi:hypothetical protein
VQHTLLGLALILIAAIAAALAAPAFVDWNAWRAGFESRASALAGAPVKIRGDISATILPQPSFLLNDIEIGGPAGLRAAQLQGLLSLGPLMRGVIEAEELVLRRPSMGVVIESGGQVTFPLPAPRLEADQLAISRISIINGTLKVEDRANNAVHKFEDVRASGELRSLAGPFRLDVSAMLKDRRWTARINLGRVGPDSSGRLRFSVESAEAGFSLDADGALAVADAVPRFDGKTTIAWRAGSGPARISMNVRASAALVLLEGLQLTLANSEAPIDLTGQVRFEPPARRIDGTLAARRIDLDRATAAANAPRGFGPALGTLKDLVALAGALPYSGRLGFTAENISAGGGVVREVRADLLVRPEGLTFERFEARLPGRGLLRATGGARDALFSGEVSLEAEEPAGLVRWLSGAAVAAVPDGDLKIGGRVTIKTELEQAGSRTAFDAELRKAEGLGAVVESWLGEGEAATLARRIAEVLTPFKISGSVTDAGSGSPSVIQATARLAEIDAGLQAKFDAGALMLSESRLVLSAGNTGRLANFFGITPGLAAQGEARLELIAAGPRNSALAVTARLTAPGSRIDAEGEIGRNAEGRIDPKLSLRLDATDLRPLAAAFARASAQPLPAAGTLRIVRGDTGFVLDDIKLAVAETRISGRLALAAASPLAVSGRLAIDRAELPAILALSLGNAGPARANALWADAPFGPAPFENATSGLELEVTKLALSGLLVADDARFSLKFGAAETAIESFSATLGGGRLTGSAKLARGDMLALEARVMLSGADLARLLAGAGVKTDLRGRGELTLTFAGSGRTPAALVASLAGQGLLTMESFEVAQLDPAALAAVLATTSNPPPDETKTASLLASLFTRGPLALARVEAPVTLVAGIARVSSVRTSAGQVQVTAMGSIDVPRLQLDATIELEAPSPEAVSVRPGAIVRWSGPLAAPERRIEAAALAGAIALRAMEREMREIERRDAKPPGVPPVMIEPPASVQPASPTARVPLPPLPPPVDVRPPPGAAQRPVIVPPRPLVRDPWADIPAERR